LATPGSTDPGVPEAAAPPDRPNEEESEADNPPVPLEVDLAPAPADPEPCQAALPDIAAATQPSAPDDCPQLGVDEPPESAAPAPPPEHMPEPDPSIIPLLQPAEGPLQDQDRPEFFSDDAGEFSSGTGKFSDTPRAEAEAGASLEASRPNWITAGSAELGRASDEVPSAPLQPVSAQALPALAVPQARSTAMDTVSDSKSPRVSRIAVAVVRYAAIGFGGWFAAMVVLIVVFRFVNPPTSALMLIRAAQGVEIDQRWVPLEEISPNLIRAVIVSEDGRFCRHWGIDPREILAAIRKADGGTPRGASTITMQLAKNLFLWPQQSYIRKALEVPLTLAIDALWPKTRIAEVYLNVVEWGPGIFGAEAAARRHFDRSAAKLTKRQSALLAVTLPSPLSREPAAPSRMLNRMASTIEARVRSTPAADDCVTKAR
jgi:monofunctional biosynthetic peptidoglycan transglycosylase